MVELILPLPPSENEIYRNVPGIGRAATQALRNWRGLVQVWMLQNKSEMQRVRAWVREQPEPLVLNISSAFVFHKPRLWSKQGVPKQLDASNRIKALHDAVAEILGVDDRHLWSGSFEKMQCEHIEDQCSIVWISLSKPNEYYAKAEGALEH